jgi:hypothetical protein
MYILIPGLCYNPRAKLNIGRLETLKKQSYYLSIFLSIYLSIYDNLVTDLYMCF